MDHRSRWSRLREEFRGTGVDAGRMLELQRPGNMSESVAAHISQRPCAEVPPSAPFERHISRMIRPIRSRAKPHIPVQARGHRRRIFGPLDSLGPYRPVRPDVDLPYRADGAVPYPFAQYTLSLRGIRLDAHLGADFGLACGFRQHPGLVDRPGQRFCTVDMLAHLHCHAGYDCVRVVGRADDYGIDVRLLFEHFTKIAIDFRPGISLVSLGCVFFVHVTKRDDIFAAYTLEIGAADAADANAGDIELITRSNIAAATQHAAGDDRQSCRGSHKVPARDSASLLMTDFRFAFHDEAPLCSR